MTVAAPDTEVIAAQLGRTPRAVRAVASRCPCGSPCVIETAPRLDGGVPFPTLYYLTCPKAVAVISCLEAAGAMRRMAQRLASDSGLRRAYETAHRDYVARRDAAARAAGLRPLPPGTQSAGGMPDRVKCLHALAAHELAVPGINPFGREALAAAGEWWRAGPCLARADGGPAHMAGASAADVAGRRAGVVRDVDAGGAGAGEADVRGAGKGGTADGGADDAGPRDTAAQQ